LFNLARTIEEEFRTLINS